MEEMSPERRSLGNGLSPSFGHTGNRSGGFHPILGGEECRRETLVGSHVILDRSITVV